MVYVLVVILVSVNRLDIIKVEILPTTDHITVPIMTLALSGRDRVSWSDL